MMKTPTPQISTVSSRVIDPSEKGRSRPAVPVTLNANPVMQAALRGKVPPPFRQQAVPVNAPLQFALRDARDWVKANSIQTGYPVGWASNPTAPEMRKYITAKKAGWKDLQDAWKAPGQGNGTAKTTKPKAKTTTPKTNTTTPSNGTNGLSAAAIKWQERKQKLSDKVDAANDAIKKATKNVDDFYEKLLNVPANIRVKINDLVDAAKVKLDKEHSRLAYFSTSILAITKEKSSPVKKATPEIQTAIIKDSKGALSLKISGNNSNVNNFLSAELGGKTLEQGYQSTVRPFHVKRKASALEDGFKQQKPESLKRIKLTELPKQPKVGDFKKDKKKDVFVLRDGSGKPYTPKEFKKAIKEAFAYDLHKSTKTQWQNRQRKGARHFVKKHRNKQLSKAPVSVPKNALDIHAESAILEELKAQANKAIIAVGGTKVACTACQAYYTKYKHEDLLGDNTSFAWLSESSINQLGFDADEVTEYLVAIREILEKRLADLRFFEGKSGTFGEENLVEESDIDTDSEDEDAMEIATQSSTLNKLADDVMDLL